MNKKIWDNIFVNKSWGEYPSEYLVREIKILKRRKKKIDLLDLGCGPGANFLLYFKENIDFDGIDISIAAINKFKKIIKKYKKYKKSNLICGNFFKISDTKRKYDVIIDSSSTSYISLNQYKLLLPKIYDKLKPSGIFWTRCFGYKTTGFYNKSSFISPKIGPIINHGKTRVVKKNEMIKLLKLFKWKKIEVEEIIRKKKDKTILHEYLFAAVKDD